jgi:hypothetical protein
VGADALPPRSASAPRIGYLVVNGQTAPVPFAVRDFRHDGATIVTAGWLGLPQRFHLHVDPDGIRFECAIRWKRGDRVGVSFGDKTPHRRGRVPLPSGSVTSSG